jgi:hypothetical protein
VLRGFLPCRMSSLQIEILININQDIKQIFLGDPALIFLDK